MLKIATLTTVYNRENASLSSLDSLFKQVLDSDIKIDHYIVDDKSTDNTVKKISEIFPTVKVFNGNGSLYWAGGMRFGYQLIEIKEYDFLFVYNDDCLFDSKMLKNLIDTALFARKYYSTESIVVGALISKFSGEVTYGGRLKKSNLSPLSTKLAPLSSNPSEVYTLNMNAALLPSSVLLKHGFLANYFRHGGADWEFGIRLNKLGCKIIQAPGAIGYCEKNKLEGTSAELKIDCLERFKRVFSIKEIPLYERFIFSFEHGGFFWPFVFFIPYVIVFLRCFKCK